MSKTQLVALRCWIKRVVEDNTYPAGRVFDVAIQFLIVVSLGTFVWETTPGLSDGAIAILDTVELVTVAAFTLEYVLRVAVADRPFAFVRSFYGIVDVLAVLPFYLSLGVDLRSVRILRLLRLVRTFKLARYGEALQRFKRALLLAKEELLLFSVVAAIVLYIAAAGIYLFENEAQPEAFSSMFDSLWWAVVTLTTVGYGDAYPITVGGRLFTFVVLTAGLGVVAVPTGLFASALNAVRREDEERQPGTE